MSIDPKSVECELLRTLERLELCWLRETSVYAYYEGDLMMMEVMEIS